MIHGLFPDLQGRLPECKSSTPTELKRWYRLLLEEMAQAHGPQQD